MASSLSQTRLLESAAVQSSAGNYCAPSESRPCFWSRQRHHPDDLRICALTGLTIYFDFATQNGTPRLRALADLLDDMKHTSDRADLWDSAASTIATLQKPGKCKVEAAALSPSKRHLAVCCEIRTLLGLRAHQVGAIYDLEDMAPVGRLASGKRGSGGWAERAR
jgi:hypothetical protein